MIMRKRQIKKNFFIDEYEDKILKKKIAKAKLTESDFFRSLILDKEVKEKPGLEFYNYWNGNKSESINKTRSY